MNRVKKELPKYKHAWPLLYFFIYLPWFLILEQKITPDYAGLHIIHCPLDDMIPFCFTIQRKNSIECVPMSLQE